MPSSSTIIKVDGCFYSPGVIDARGTANVPIEITSYHDDQRGGDTNGNSALTLPLPGDWEGIGFIGPGCVFEHVNFRYGGRNGGVTLDLRNNDVVVNDCLFEWSAGDAMNGASDVTCDRTQFRDLGGIPVGDLQLRNLPQFLDNTAVRCAGGDYAAIIEARSWLGNQTLDHRSSMNSNGVFVVNASTTLSPRLPLGATWTIPAGTIIKFQRGKITSLGQLDMLGTAGAPIVLTSIHDDTVGGDTQKDGNATMPAPGDWDGVEFQNGDTARLQHTTIRYAFNPAIRSSRSSAVLEDCVVEHGSGVGIQLGSPATTPLRLVRCQIRNNQGRGVAGVSWSHLVGFEEVTTSGNAGGDEFEIAPDRPSVPIHISPKCFPGDVLLVNARTTINGGGLLRLEHLAIFTSLTQTRTLSSLVIPRKRSPLPALRCSESRLHTKAGTQLQRSAWSQ